jgi:16S rRNA (guanine1207-N2)-methyltransferase
MDKDIYFHKTVTFHIGKQHLEFRTSQELFSSYNIDTGTRFLLRSIFEAGYRPKRILDMGCGYGPIGLVLKKIYPESKVHMVDRDALATEYSRQNAEINELEGIEIYGSLGYDDVKKDDFDLIASNIPGKAGESIISYLLREARYYLAPSGIAAIVVVAALESLVAKILQETPECEITLRRNRSGHAIFHYRFLESDLPKPERSAIDRRIYERDNLNIRLKDIKYLMKTAYGLPEFNSLSYGSEMLITALKNIEGRLNKRAVVFNTGQGHTTVALWKFIHPRTMELVDRDLLALRYARLNLVLNGYPPERIQISHQVGLERKDNEKVDLVVGVLRDENKEAISWMIHQAIEELNDDGMIIIAGGSTAITRLVTLIEQEGWLRIKARERRRGYSILAAEKMK